MFLTQRVLSEDVVEDPVGGELCDVARVALGEERLELRLALVEILMVSLLHGDAGVRLVHRHRELVPNALHLQTTAGMMHDGWI